MAARVVPSRTAATPWYRQFWPWFLIGLPGISVVFGIATLVVAVRNADSLVRDDYYKAGLGLNHDFALERAAAQRGLQATLTADPASRELRVRLTGSGVDPGSQLVLLLAHPTQAERDLSLDLRGADDGTFRAPLAGPLRGPWHATLAPAGGGWRMVARIDFDAPQPPRMGG